MEIVALIRQNPEVGVRKLVDEYGGRLIEAAALLGADSAAAEDYAFRALERAVTHIATFNEKSSLFTWLYSILVNLIRADARKKAANALDFRYKLPECTDERPDPAEAMALKSDGERLRKVIATLPLPMREVLTFRFWEDLTVPEIAACLSIPEGTVKSRLFEAKKLVRQKFQRTNPSNQTSKRIEGQL